MRFAVLLALFAVGCVADNPDYCAPDNFDECARIYFANHGWERAPDIAGWGPLPDLTADAAGRVDLAVSVDLAEVPVIRDMSAGPDLSAPPDLYDSKYCAPPLPLPLCRFDSDCLKDKPHCVGAMPCGDVDMKIGWRSGQCCAHPDCCMDANQGCNGAKCCAGLTCIKTGPSFVCR